jgi:glycosyltransferase involved in cell wall biosynthesis
VTPEDPRAFADAIEEALDPAIGAKLAKNARHAASKLFDLEKQCNKVLGAYSRALEPPMRRKVYACHVDR